MFHARLVLVVHITTARVAFSPHLRTLALPLVPAPGATHFGGRRQLPPRGHPHATIVRAALGNVVDS